MTAEGLKVYLDTNVFLAAFETVGARGDHAAWILAAIENGDISGVTSEMTLAELLPGPIEDGDVDLANAYQQMLVDGPNMRVCPISRDTLLASASLRAGRRGLKLPDAIHVATALRNECVVIVTDDRRMPRDAGVRVVNFGPHTLDEINETRR